VRITDIRAVPLVIGLDESPPLAGEVLATTKASSSHHVLVEVLTDAGVAGYGEAWRFTPGAVTAFIEEGLKPMLLGQDPTQIEKLWDLMYRTTFRYGRKGLPMHCISGIEIALWDIVGKYRGLPVYEMLGGLCRDRVQAYASLLRYQKPEDAATVALRSVEEEGYRAIKLHAHEPTVVETVRAVRNAIGAEITLMIDVNGAWTPRQAVERIKELKPYGLLWVEEPVHPMDDYDGLAYVRDRSSVMIAAGENEYTHYGFKELVSRRAVDVLQPDVTKSGGLLACRKIMALAEAWNLQVIPHSFYYGPGVAATLQFALSSMTTEYVEIHQVPLQASFIQPTLRPEQGYLSAPAKSGLGIDVDEHVVMQHRYSV
jgi:L-alanine-DL-glutamate epimerase-like enolase superfamily enzyme